MKKKNSYVVGSDNIFADLGFPDAQEMLAKAELARQINNLIKQKKLNQIEAAELLKVDQPKISALSKGKLSGFSLERLFRFLNVLDQKITIKVTPKTKIKKQTDIDVILPKIKRNNLKEISFTHAIQAKKKSGKR